MICQAALAGYKIFIKTKYQLTEHVEKVSEFLYNNNYKPVNALWSHLLISKMHNGTKKEGG